MVVFPEVALQILEFHLKHEKLFGVEFQGYLELIVNGNLTSSIYQLNLQLLKAQSLLSALR